MDIIVLVALIGGAGYVWYRYGDKIKEVIAVWKK